MKEVQERQTATQTVREIERQTDRQTHEQANKVDDEGGLSDDHSCHVSLQLL